MIEMLPQILFIAQIVTYLLLAWFLGSLAFRGMRKKIPLPIKIIAMLGIGFLCLIIGVVLGDYMFFFKGTILQTFQIDLFLGGLIGSIAVALALYMITRKEKGMGGGKMIKKLQERVSLLEGLLLRYRVPTLREDEVKKTAETLVPGFSAKQANLKKTEWEVLLEKEERKAKVIFGAYTGEVKKIEHLGARGLLSDPLRIIGIGVIIFLIAFSLLNFKGFPSMMEDVASLLGMSPEQFETLTGSEDLPEGCVPTIRILMSQGLSVLGGENSYMDDNLRQMIEERHPGREVFMMTPTEYEGENYVLSFTLPKGMNFEGMSSQEILNNAEICSSIGDTMCDCIQIPDLGGLPTGFIAAVGA